MKFRLNMTARPLVVRQLEKGFWKFHTSFCLILLGVDLRFGCAEDLKMPKGRGLILVSVQLNKSKEWVDCGGKSRFNQRSMVASV